MNLPAKGFGGLSKLTKPPVAPVAAPVAAKSTLLDKAKAEIKKPLPVATPVKSRSQQLREEAEAAEAAEQAELNAAAEPTAEIETAPEPQEEAPKSRAVANFGGIRGLSTIDGKTAVNSLMAFVEAAEAKRVPSLFPVIECTGGESGGIWASPDWQDQALGDSLPQGNKTLKCLYLGYRLDIIAWPAEYTKGTKAKPCYSGVIPCNDIETTTLAVKACKNYQFTKKDFKNKFDVDADGHGAGRPSPSVEIIVFLPEIKGLAVLRSAPGFGPSTETLSNLARLIDAETGLIPNMPVAVKILTKSEASAAQKWPTHYFDFTPDTATAAGKAVAKEFSAFASVALEDPEFMAKFNDWMSGGDRAITDDMRARLDQASKL